MVKYGKKRGYMLKSAFRKAIERIKNDKEFHTVLSIQYTIEKIIRGKK